tara:strand:+ start:314 stop:478 length:165 start_codon:yes stop_codon:yes gene_type:complete
LGLLSLVAPIIVQAVEIVMNLAPRNTQYIAPEKLERRNDLRGEVSDDSDLVKNQ